MNKIRKGDEVIVLCGRDKKKRGNVSRVLKNNYIVVDGINIVKKHIKANPMNNNPGGIIDKNLPIHISNVAIFNPVTQKSDRIGFNCVDGKKVRIFKSNGAVVNSDKA